MKVLVLDGPDLGRLGAREPEADGEADHAELARRCADWGAALGLEVEVRRTDDEAELVGWLNEAADAALPVVLNPGAFAAYASALRGACARLRAPLVEVHLTNPARPGTFWHTSVVAGTATGSVAGFGTGSYELALRAVADRLAERPGA